MNKLAIIDWGIGGLSIYKLIKDRSADVGITYFSDTGATPYGKMSRTDLISRLDQIIRYLEDSGITHLLIGCNAASTAIPDVQPRSLNIEGVILPAVDSAVRARPKRLGLIGGRRTVVSGVYRKAFSKRGITVEQRVAQPLSGLIESGDTGSDLLRSEARRILSPLKNCSHIVLACTHYPAITEILREFVSNETKFVDPAPALAQKVSSAKFSGRGQDVFLTSGDAEGMKRAAVNAFGVNVQSVTRLQI